MIKVIREKATAIPSRERFMFFYKFIQSPRQIGSVTPSSHYLSDKMLSMIDWTKIRSIGELGAGTGIITEQILKSMSPGCKLAVFEKDPDMRNLLQQKFPEITCFEEAQLLTRSLLEINLTKLDSIVSGLPFSNFSDELRNRILDEVAASLSDDGVFVTFQYSLKLKKLLTQKFSRVETHFVLMNIPPAFVFVCRK
jgi:phospholipid N-methyltransferase